MAIRWRKDGRLVCAAKSHPLPCDTYIDDRLTNKLRECGTIVADHAHKQNGLWHWNFPHGLAYRNIYIYETRGINIG